MMNTIWAIVQDGKILPEERVELREGQRVLVTLLVAEENKFWMDATAGTLDAIWGNETEEIYSELLAV